MIAALTVALVVGWLASTVATYWETYYPSADGLVSQSPNRHWIYVNGLSDRSHICNRRISSGMLYPASEATLAPGQERHYIALGTAQNGLAYLDAVPHYAVAFWVMPDLEGDYLFDIRSDLVCLGGWVTINDAIIPPIPVTLGWN